MSNQSTLYKDFIGLLEALTASGRTEKGIARCTSAVSQLMVEMVAKERFEQGEPWDDIVRDCPTLDKDVPVRDIIEEVKIQIVEDGCLVTDTGNRFYCKTEGLTKEEAIENVYVASKLQLMKDYITNFIENKPVQTVTIDKPDFTFQVILDRLVVAKTAIMFYNWD